MLVEEVARRRSLGRIGLSAGYFIPFDDLVYTETDWDDNTTETKYPQLFKMNYNYYHQEHKPFFPLYLFFLG